MEPQTLWRNRPLKTNILDIQFDNLTREEARQAGAELLRSSDFHYAVTPNPEFILTADKDLEFQKILNQADLVLPDGIGVVYSCLLYTSKKDGQGTTYLDRLSLSKNLAGGEVFLV